MNEDLIPLFAIFFVFGAPCLAWIVSRVLSHQERVEMIRNGYMPPPDPRAMRRAARYGAWPGAMPPPPPGTGAPIPPMPTYHDNYYAQAQLRKGVTVSLVGMALLIGLSFIGNNGYGGYHYGPWLLGGLVPLFVGVAQIINAVLNGATIGRMGMGSGQGSAGPASFGPRMNQPGPSPSAPPPPSGPYAWRPGSTPEIEKPVQPPDSR